MGLPFMHRAGWAPEGGAPPSGGPASAASDRHPWLVPAPQDAAASPAGPTQERGSAAPDQRSRVSGYAALSDEYLEQGAERRSSPAAGAAAAAAGSQPPAAFPWSVNGTEQGPLPQAAPDRPAGTRQGERGAEAGAATGSASDPSTRGSSGEGDRKAQEPEAGSNAVGSAAGSVSDMPPKPPAAGLFGPPPPPAPRQQQEGQERQGSTAFLQELSRDGPASAGARRG